MKNLHPSMLRFAMVILLVVPSLSLRGADIAFNTNGSAAYTPPGNWVGGLVPGQNDVAQFGLLGPSTGIGITMQLTEPDPGIVHVGAFQMLNTRTTDLVIGNSSTSTSGVVTFFGATVNGVANTILSNEDDNSMTVQRNQKNGTLNMSIALQTGSNHVIQVNGSGDAAITIAIAGSNSSITVGGTGSGRAILGGLNSTYSGGTIVNAGTLLLTNSGAAGTGAITVNNSSQLQVGADLTVTNAIHLTSQSASYERSFSAASNYSVYAAQSDLGGTDTTATLLDGVTGGTRDVTGSFATTSLATNDSLRSGDVFNLDGTQGDIITLQLSLSSGVEAGDFLGWLNGGEWVNAIAGNSTIGGSAVQGFNGSYLAAGVDSTTAYLGSWGYDVSNNAVWAVLDHNSSFGVIPEPTSVALLGLGILGVVFFHRKRCPARNG